MINRLTKEQQIYSGNIVAKYKRISGHYRIHWHEYYEIEFILSGSGKYIVDGKEYEIKKGMLFFMSPINFHEVIPTDAEIINARFSEDICDSNTLFRLTSGLSENAFYFSDTKFLEELFCELIKAVNSGNDTYSASILNTLLLKILTASKNRQKEPENLSYVQSAMLFVQNNFRRKLTLKETASHIGLSSAYLSSIFPAETGKKFKEYVDSLRFEYAKKLLTNSDMSVSEICYESGFEDYANFLRRFKVIYGMPPGQYRQISKKERETKK